MSEAMLEQEHKTKTRRTVTSTVDLTQEHARKLAALVSVLVPNDHDVFVRPTDEENNSQGLFATGYNARSTLELISAGVDVGTPVEVSGPDQYVSIVEQYLTHGTYQQS